MRRSRRRSHLGKENQEEIPQRTLPERAQELEMDLAVAGARKTWSRAAKAPTARPWRSERSRIGWFAALASSVPDSADDVAVPSSA